MISAADVNVGAVLVAAIASMIIGGLWYSPMLFGKLWMQLSGMTEKQLREAKKKGMGKSYTLTFIGSLITAYVLAHFVRYMQAANIAEGFTLGFWIWLGFVAPMMLGMVLWENKSWKLFILKAAHELVMLLIMSAILAVWA